MKKSITLILIAIILIIIATLNILSGCTERESDGKIHMPFGGNDYNEMNYQDAIHILEGAGFTNVKAEALGDMIVGLLHKEGEIKTIKVAGSDVFSKDSKYLPDTEIIVKYHSYPKENNAGNSDTINEAADEAIDEATEIYNNALNKFAIDIKNELGRIGYKSEFIHNVTKQDFSESILNSDSEFYVPFVIVKLGHINSETKTALFYIDTTENIERVNEQASIADELNHKLDSNVAWQAVKSYGNEQYIYGFKLHYIKGKLAETVENNDTWFLKAYCDVADVNGIWIKNLICEARVSGSTQNPSVDYFEVY